MFGEMGLGPYAASAVFAVGVFFSTFAFNMFFVNLSVEGDPVEIGDYFKAHPKFHVLGLSGGALWTVGATAALAAGAAPPEAHLSPTLTYQLSQGFAVIAALWGLLAWREFRGADTKTKFMTLAMLIFFIGGVVLISLAPLYVRRG